ncbi:MAG: hypothetical protein G01um1014106_746 [Parcubacteria group bacterium Gr01-1014_106]|nr:MAG: hypothetical protein G01um1014106_746 [Parcubacteria group bacterium Gr01-1014_106]
MDQFSLAAAVGNVLNIIFTPHVLAETHGVLKAHGLSGNKLRQAALKFLIKAIEEGKLTHTDLKRTPEDEDDA